MTTPLTLDVNLSSAVAIEATKALLHAILFHRLLGSIRPQTIDCLNVTVPILDDEELDQQLLAKATDFVDSLKRDTSKGNQVILLFYERPPKKTWFSRHTTEPWEQWVISVNVIDEDPPYAQSSESLQQALEKLVLLVNSRVCSYLPPVVSENGQYPYEIVVNSASEGWGTLLKRMLIENVSSGE
ncbi:meiotically upregulated Mug66 [Schizosaccharomyces japonicus yFS275]|uniref:Autophagy-related protein 101 n=1 Tax=Schizosaccharomyces japonicus (strain yFS275 / FY16936) TaxID=402676 RepID=B6K2H2_SCHJY|nr:meiotically upregulated Mug66 [Schizosaccharomyces japonicus yFS275]EEB07353.1 meiotically upregulated Mug66 [Schizosaccharomyces japonicus yFS275]